MLPESLLNEAQQSLTKSSGEKVCITSVDPLSGGDINRTFRLKTPKNSFFLKYNFSDRYPSMFAAEARGLKLLSETATLRIPNVIGSDESGEYGWLLLEYIEQGTSAKNFWDTFGAAIANMHRNSNDYFGLDHNNYIGSLPQSNRKHKKWCDFFIEERLQIQLELARNTGLADRSLIKHFENLYKAIPSIFPIEPSSLIHGDFWNGNFMSDEKGNPCLIDPAVYYGFREMDIAMSKLFGGFDSRFYESYHNTFPFVPGWQNRIEICNLYPLLVHLNLFGSSYSGSVKSIVNRF